MRSTLINGRWPLILPDHRADFHEERPWWEAARLADMYAHLKPGDVLIDVGSEEGDLSALYATWGCDVIPIDPSFPWMSQTLATFAVNAVPIGVSFVGFASDVTLISGVASPERGFSHLEEQPEISQTTLDDFCGYLNRGPDALTVDVEGSELRVLKGAETILKDLEPIVWVSIHGDIDHDAVTPSPVHEYMRSFGYDDQFLAFDHEWHYRFWRD